MSLAPRSLGTLGIAHLKGNVPGPCCTASEAGAVGSGGGRPCAWSQRPTLTASGTTGDAGRKRLRRPSLRHCGQAPQSNTASTPRIATHPDPPPATSSPHWKAAVGLPLSPGEALTRHRQPPGQREPRHARAVAQHAEPVGALTPLTCRPPCAAQASRSHWGWRGAHLRKGSQSCVPRATQKGQWLCPSPLGLALGKGRDQVAPPKCGSPTAASKRLPVGQTQRGRKPGPGSSGEMACGLPGRARPVPSLRNARICPWTCAPL